MIVRYNQLNRLETPALTLCNPGSVYLDGELSNVVGVLTDHEAEEIVFNFNAASELNFRINKIEREDPDENAHAQRMYQEAQNRRLVFVEDIGYFMISNIDDGFDGVKHYKDVKAKSIDVELAQKLIPYIEDGTYPFMTDATSQNKGIFEIIVESIPLWKIGEVDERVAEKWRTFTDLDSSLNCLSFLLQNCQDAFECIFVFNPIHRTINVYSQDNYVRKTNIHITKNDLINSLDITENADDLYTAISVMGGGNVTISAINPLGSNVIYNFRHYLPWMSKDLGNKVAAWHNAVDKEKSNYYGLNLSYFRTFDIVSDYQLQIDAIETQIKMYKRCRDNIVAESDTILVDRYNAEIATCGGEMIVIYDSIEDTISYIDRLIDDCEEKRQRCNSVLATNKTRMDAYLGDINAIRDRLSIKNYFTKDEYTELSMYIFEGKYTDEYIIFTEGMTYYDKFEQMKTLYDRAEAQLAKVTAPTQEFNIDVENFIFSKEFEQWNEQLETGCLINVELGSNNVVALFLSSMTVNYDDHTLLMTFGNRFNKYDPKSLFDDVLGNITKTANTLTHIKDILYPIKNGEFDTLKEAMATSRSLTMGQALSSANEDIVIDGSGYTGRKKLDDGTYDDHQIKITGKNIVFTTDSWDTCKVAIGSLVLDNGVSAYGINAETILGDMIIGGGLKIFDNNGNELLSIIDNITTRVTDAEGNFSALRQTINGFTFTVSDNSGDSAKLTLKSGKTVLASATITMDGLVTFTDLSTAGSTTISGSNITTGTIDASKVTVANLSANNITSGTLNATNVTIDAATIKSGTIDAARIPNLSADKITSGRLNGRCIDGSTLEITEGATIAGWCINNNSIYSNSGSWWSGTFMCTGSEYSYSIGGSALTTGWVFGAGGKFGVTSSGAVWCSNLNATGGSIGGWIIEHDIIRTASGIYGTHTLNDDGAVRKITGYLFTVLTSQGVCYAISASNAYTSSAYTFHSTRLLSSTAFGGDSGGTVV